MRRNSSVQIPMKYRAALYVLLLVLVIPVSVYAAEEPPEDEGSLIERLMSLPVEGIYRAIQALGFKNYDELIFDTSRGDMSPFTGDEWNIVMTWYNAIRNAVWVMLVISAAFTGFRFMKSGGSPQKRSEAMRVAMSNIYAFAIVLFMPYFARIIFQMNSRMVSLFYSIAEGMGAVGSDGFDINSIKTGSIIATAFVRLGYAGLILFFNFLYVIRKFVITSMLIVTPIAAWSWSISGRYHGIGVVIGEVASNVFMQAAHALVLALYLTLLEGGVAGDFSPWWAQIFGMVALIPTANVIRNLLQGWLQFMGVNEERWAGLATLGLSGIAGLVTIGKTMAMGRMADATAATGINSFGGGSSTGGTGSHAGNAGYSSVVGKSGRTSYGYSEKAPAMANITAGVGRTGSAASGIGGVAGKIIGGAMGIPMGSSGIKHLSNIGEKIGGGITGGVARSAAAGYGLVKEARKGEGGFVSNLKDITGAKDGMEAAGAVLGTVTGAALGERGMETGARIGRKTAKGMATTSSIITGVNLDGFRWN